MQRIWDDIRTHRLASALFAAWWLALTLLNFIGPRRSQGLEEQLHFLLPVIAGALVCWWRRFGPERITGGTLAGATVLLLDSALQLPRELMDALARGKELPEALKQFVDVEVLALAAFSGILGAVLGFVGALVAVAFANARTSAAEPVDNVTAIGGRRIMPRPMLAVAGGLVLVATVIFASGIAGRAVPPHITTVNFLVAVALLAPISRWSDDTGRALALIAGFVSFSLGSGVLILSGFTWAERPAMLSVAVSVAALAQLGGGVLALIATFRKPDVHYAA